MVAHDAGIVEELERALVEAEPNGKLRVAALNGLRGGTESEPARAKMRDGKIIARAAELLAAGVEDRREVKAARALRLLLVLSGPTHYDWRSRKWSHSSPPEKCETDARERTPALMLLANVYAEALQIHDGSDDCNNMCNCRADEQI